MSETTLLYLTDPHRLQAEAEVLEADQDDHGCYVICDQTPFYPQGGGQPTDSGEIRWDQGKLRADVVFVALDEMPEIQVRHYISGSELPEVGSLVKFFVDPDKRRTHRILHSAGHVVSHVVESRYPELKSIKGYHFADSPYVELQPPDDNWEIEDKEAFLTEINASLESALKAAGATKIEHKDEGGNLPLRIVSLPGVGPVPCGGTHVDSLAEISQIKVTKMKKKRGNFRLSYSAK